MSNTNSVDTINFEADVLRSDLPVLVDFWAAWCGPCHRVAPEVEAVAEQWQGRLKVFKLNVDESPQIAMQYNVQSIPTLILFRDGAPIGRIVGAVPRSMILDELETALGATAPVGATR
jgi:thioredoxin 1